MIYLNNSATSFPKPETVISAMNDALQRPSFAPNRGSCRHKSEAHLIRQKLADLFSATPDNIILTPSATYSLNLVIHGALHGLKQAHCLTTTQEHNSVLRPLNHLKESQKLDITYFPISYCDSSCVFDTDGFEAQIRPETRLIVINHCSNVTGFVLPINKIINIAAKHSIALVIDASQSAGAVDLNLQKEAPLYICFAGHKGLFGPCGTGGIVLNGPLFPPIIQGGTGSRSDLLTQPKDLPLYYEAGTPNYPGFAGLERGVSFVLDHGVHEIGKHKQRLMELLIAALQQEDRIQLFLPENRDFQSGCLSLAIDGLSIEEVGFILEESFDIFCRTGLHCAPLIHKELGTWPKGTVRLSLSYFTTESEIEQTITAIKTICKS